MARTATKRGLLASIASAAVNTSASGVAAAVAAGGTVNWSSTGYATDWTILNGYLSDDSVSFSMRQKRVPIPISELGNVPIDSFIREYGLESITFAVETMDENSIAIATNITDTGSVGITQTLTDAPIALALEISGVGLIEMQKCTVTLEGGPDVGFKTPGKYTFKAMPQYSTGCAAGWRILDFSYTT
jgi:hypothetical protein